MDSKPLEITLVPALDDLPEDSSEYQAQLREFDEFLQNEGNTPSSVVLLMEAAGHDVTPYLGVFKVALTGISTLAVAIGAYFQGKNGRKVRLKIGDTEAEASTVAEVLALLGKAQAVREQNEPKRITP